MNGIAKSLTLAIMIAYALGLASARAGEFAFSGRTFSLPDGFELEQVAGPGLIDRPIVADFDDEGRLYVADSSGSNDKVEKQLEDKPHRIMRLEDRDGDGKFDASKVFADRLMFPEGAMWLAGSLYVAAPPSIWKFTDHDGDGVAEERIEWFAGKTLTGCANDLHGPYAGPDGGIYWCKGAFAKQTYERTGKPPLETRASHIFRCRPDGGGIEPVMTGGMDNPVEVAFTTSGDRIFSTTFLQHPGGGKRDGLIHAIYGGVYGKIHDVIEDHPRTGDVLPVLSHLGPAAPCGLARFESANLGADFQDTLFTCCFNLHKVTRTILTPEGASYRSRDEDFLTCDNLDFHPTDTLEDPKGGLLVVDTGGWYKLCCPTSHLHKPDVLGAIYRIRKTGVAPVADPWGLKVDWEHTSPADLANYLDDDRPTVRRRAIRQLAKDSPEHLSTLARIISESLKKQARAKATDKKSSRPASAQARQNAVWALASIPTPEARRLTRVALADSNATVRKIALHAVSLWRDAEAAPLARDILADPSRGAAESRLAVEVAGRLGDREAIPLLFEIATKLGSPPDRVLEHSLIFALIEIDAPEETARGLAHVNPAARRVALLGLDQSPSGQLSPVTVANLLDSPEPPVRETAAWIAGRRPEWSGDLASYLKSKLYQREFNAEEATRLADLLARFARSSVIADLLSDSLLDGNLSTSAKEIALIAIARSGVREPPLGWYSSIAAVLDGTSSNARASSADPDARVIELAVAAARALPTQGTPPARSAPTEGDPAARAIPAEFSQALARLGGLAEYSDRIRLEALAAIPGGLSAVEPSIFEFLTANLRPEREVLDRTIAADILARSKLTSDQLTELVNYFKTAGPIEGDRLLGAFQDASDGALGAGLIAALRASPGLMGLRVDAIGRSVAKFPPSVQEQAAELYKLLNADLEKQRARLDELLSSLAPGDVRRGFAVFHGKKAACAACHAVGYVGGNTGPDLTRIGGTRTERDLLEAIVYPSASFVRSFESVVVVTKSGKSHNGLIRNDSTDEILLATGPREEVRIARDDIDEIGPSSVSIMPAGLDKQLTPEELADLLAFLKGAK